MVIDFEEVSPHGAQYNFIILTFFNRFIARFAFSFDMYKAWSAIVGNVKQVAIIKAANLFLIDI